jgi:D-glycero-alpha-D-manno-heptose 1-phosphate guanylyltransferase
MQAIVLAGGMGRQIKLELGNIPKPMAVVNGRPFLEFVLLFLKKNGIEDIIVSCGYMRPVIESYFESGKEWGVKIRYTDEDFLRGTAGSVKLAEDLIEEDHFLVVNGDTFHDIPVYELLEAHLRFDTFVTMALKESLNPEKYGAVELLENQQVLRFLGRGHKDYARLVNTGIYVFNKEVLKFIQPNESISLEKDIFPLLTKLGKLYGYVCNDYFLDIEVPENYETIKKKLKELAE